MPKVELSSVPVRTACGYPAPYDAHCLGRAKQALGDAGKLTQFGVNLTRLAPGAASAHQHWHKNEDELIYLLEGEAVLVEDDGEAILRPGDFAAFKAGVENGHMLINRSDEDVVFLEIGTRADEEVSSYSDPNVDLKMIKEAGGPWVAFKKSGERY